MKDNIFHNFLKTISIIAVTVICVMLLDNFVLKNNRQGGFENLYAMATQSVVTIEVADRFGNVSGGSGVVYKIENEDVYIVTNAHVIENASSFTVYDYELSSTEKAVVLGYDIYHDLAVLKVQDLPDVREVNHQSNFAVNIGEEVFAIGSPLAKEYYGTITNGIISGPERFVLPETNSYWGLRLLQTNTVINPGNSGGALFNMEGEIIGINTIKYIDDHIEGMGFAIPFDDVLERIEYYERGDSTRVIIGINISQDLIISRVIPNTPAASSELQVKDKIVSIDGQEVGNLYTFNYHMYSYLPGDEVVLVVERAGETVEIKIVLGYYED